MVCPFNMYSTLSFPIGFPPIAVTMLIQFPLAVGAALLDDGTASTGINACVCACAPSLSFLRDIFFLPPPPLVRTSLSCPTSQVGVRGFRKCSVFRSFSIDIDETGIMSMLFKFRNPLWVASGKPKRTCFSFSVWMTF